MHVFLCSLPRDSFSHIYLMYFACAQDEEEDVFKRDFSAPTLEDHFNKTILPKVMQVWHSFFMSHFTMLFHWHLIQFMNETSEHRCLKNHVDS